MCTRASVVCNRSDTSGIREAWVSNPLSHIPYAILIAPTSVFRFIRLIYIHITLRNYTYMYIYILYFNFFSYIYIFIHMYIYMYIYTSLIYNLLLYSLRTGVRLFLFLFSILFNLYPPPPSPSSFLIDDNLLVFSLPSNIIIAESINVYNTFLITFFFFLRKVKSPVLDQWFFVKILSRAFHVFIRPSLLSSLLLILLSLRLA